MTDAPTPAPSPKQRRAHGAHSRAAVSRVVEALRAQPGANPECLADLEGALKESEQLEAVLQRVRFAERL